MPRRRRLSRAEQKTRNRARLLQAGAKVLAAQGYSATTLDQIAEEAGLTKGAVYSNFASKADLALAVLAERVDTPQREIFTRVDEHASFEDQLEQGSKLLGEALDAGAPWFQVELECVAEALRDPQLLGRLRARDSTNRAELAKQVTERLSMIGWTPTVGPEVIVVALTALTNGIALERLKDSDAMSDDVVVQLLGAIYSALAREDDRSSREGETESSDAR